METIRGFFAAPDPKVQLQKANAHIRQNTRSIEREIARSKQTEAKFVKEIRDAHRTSQRNPNLAAQAQRNIRSHAASLVQARRNTDRLYTAKAQLASIKSQIDMQYAMAKIEGSMKVSVGIMKDTGARVDLPHVSETCRQLQMEFMKAGVRMEMQEDIMEDAFASETPEGLEEEADKVLGEVLKEKTVPQASREPKLPAAPLPEPSKQQAEEDEEDMISEPDVDQLKERLRALGA